MKYVWLALALFGEFVAYMFLCVAFGWKYGGGIIPQILLWSIFAATWRGIMKHNSNDGTAGSFGSRTDDDSEDRD